MASLASLLDSADARVSLLLIEFHIPPAQSLKDKRRVLKSVVDKLRARFNASISEVGGQDLWQRGVIAFCMVANDSQYLESNCQKALNLLETVNDFEILKTDLLVS